jgi:hypothetical protein
MNITKKLNKKYKNYHEKNHPHPAIYGSNYRHRFSVSFNSRRYHARKFANSVNAIFVDLCVADFNTGEGMNEHETRMKITKVLIDSGLSISKQMEVINHIKSTLKSIKIDCAPKQSKLF